MADGVNINVSQDLILPIIQAKIEAGIIEALHQSGNGQGLIEQVVHQVLHRKVQYDGSVSSYSSDNRHDYLAILCQKGITEAANGAIKAVLESRRAEVQAAIEAELKKHATQTKMAKALIDGVCDIFTHFRAVKFCVGKEEL